VVRVPGRLWSVLPKLGAGLVAVERPGFKSKTEDHLGDNHLVRRTGVQAAQLSQQVSDRVGGGTSDHH
jgi:hypothetical protein